jgi:hypothetical protein
LGGLSIYTWIYLDRLVLLSYNEIGDKKLKSLIIEAFCGQNWVGNWGDLASNKRSVYGQYFSVTFSLAPYRSL